MARSADELQSQSPSPSSSQLQNKQLWSKGASFTRNDLHEAARRSFAKSRARNEARGTRDGVGDGEEAATASKLQHKREQIVLLSEHSFNSQGSTGGGACRGLETACVLRRLPRSHTHTHTHTLPQRVARVVGRFVLGSQSQSQSRPGPGSVSGSDSDEGWLQLRLRL